MDTRQYLLQRKSPNWKFSFIVDKDSFMNVNRVHPLKQKIVQSIVAAAKEDKEVKRIIIFGSSVRYDCDIDSDLDICIDWKQDCYDADGILKPFTKNMRKIISAVTKGLADVVNYQYVAGTDIDEAVEKGVVVYEYNV
ncbi:nucleotidyltransferase domain-containing protein [Phascolarctobacterium sp.]|uniref:nucleotidyltransferase domain-containing protein n=1 Tax=Phascolarctobacterium sp. TaxID=2049039 RepID=UPI00386B2713